MSHIHEKIDFTVGVFIVNNGRVLLRRHDKYNIWLGVGGHIELDEDPVEAAIREAKEEVGLDIELWDSGYGVASDGGEYKHRELIPPVFVNRHNISPTHEHVTFEYFAVSKSSAIAPQEGEASVECHWISKDELVSLDLSPHIRKYAEIALNTVKE